MQANCVLWLAILVIVQNFVAGLAKKEEGKSGFYFVNMHDREFIRFFL